MPAGKRGAATTAPRFLGPPGRHARKKGRPDGLPSVRRRPPVNPTRAGGGVSTGKLYRVALKGLFYVVAGFSLRLHRRDACATL
jgi:hypothetical protein